MVRATQGDRTAAAEAPIVAVEAEEQPQIDLGIPEPGMVDDPAGNWRSRLLGDRWEPVSASASGGSGIAY